MPQHPTLIRKRLIPLETLRLERDVVVHRSDRLLVTRWTTIKPKKELHHGSSCFLLKEGWKVSRFIEEIPPQLLDEEEQPTVFGRAAGMSRGGRGFEDSGTSGWTTGSFGVSCAGDGDRVRIGGMSGKHPLSENDAAWERGAARMSGWGGVNGSGSAGSSRTLDPYKSAYSSSSRPASPAPSFGKAFTVQKADHLSYGEGDRVRHLKFGEGTVQKIADGGKDFEVTVNFDRVGVKKMFASFAKLVKC